jgi:hypothetical protein
MESSNPSENKEVKQEAKTPQVVVQEHPNFRTITVSGLYGLLNEWHYEIYLYSQYFDPVIPLETFDSSGTYPNKYTRVLECRLLIDPINVKSIARWLMEKVREYEEQFGNIPPAEDQQKTAEDQIQTTEDQQHTGEDQPQTAEDQIQTTEVDGAKRDPPGVT